MLFYTQQSFPGGPSVKNLSANAGDVRDSNLILGSGRSLGDPWPCPGGRQGNSLQYSCIENPMDRGAWRATVQGVAETRLKRLTCTRTRRTSGIVRPEKRNCWPRPLLVLNNRETYFSLLVHWNFVFSLLPWSGITFSTNLKKIKCHY